EHRTEHSLQAIVRTPALGLLDHQELIIRRLLNLDEVRHLGDFLNMSKELAYAFATGECLLRHRGLSFHRPSRGRPFRSATAIAPRVEFRSISKARSPVSDQLSPESVLQTAKTQNDARGTEAHPPVKTIFVTDCKSPKSPALPTASRGKRRRPRLKPCFRAAIPIWDDNLGDSRGK